MSHRMQFSNLTIYCTCIVSTILRCVCLQKGTVKARDAEECIVARVCVLPEVGTAASCTEKIFTSESASDVGLHLSLETCVPAGQPWPDVGWFVDRPVQRWLAECWNKTQCWVEVETGSGQLTRVGVVLGVRKGPHSPLTLHTCHLSLISHTGLINIFHGEGRDLGCWDEGSMGTLTHVDTDTGTVLWVLPPSAHHNIYKHRTWRKRKELLPERHKRDLFETKEMGFIEIPSPDQYRSPKSKLRDIIFSDFDDKGDTFTGQLTPDEEAWNADMPTSLNAVMTFPDDFLDRISMPRVRQKQKMKTLGRKGKVKVGSTGQKIRPPMEELPQFTPTNNLLPMESVKEGRDRGDAPMPDTGSPQSLHGKDMQMALKETIENRLRSSLDSLLKDEQVRHKEDMALVSSLALENKVNDALASMDSSAVAQEADLKQQKPVIASLVEHHPPVAPLTDGQARPVQSLQHGRKRLQSQKGVEVGSGDKGKTQASFLPPPEPAISNNNKPSTNLKKKTTNSTKPVSQTQNSTVLNNRTANINPLNITIVINSSLVEDAFPNTSLPTTSAVMNSTSPIRDLSPNSSTLTANVSLSRNLSAGTSTSKLPVNTTANGNRVVMLYVHPQQTMSTNGLSQTNRQVLKQNVINAERSFKSSFKQLQKQMREALHEHPYPASKKFLEIIEPGVRLWGHSVSWIMIKQVCTDAVKRMWMKQQFGWLDWSPWSPCTMTCGSIGYQVRHRRCQQQLECCGSSYDLRPCTSQPPCQGSSTWLSWTRWEHCSVTCGKRGVRFRMRTCLTHDPSILCEGSGTDFVKCQSQKPCPGNKSRKHHRRSRRKQGHHSHRHHSHRRRKRRKEKGTSTSTLQAVATHTRYERKAKRHRDPWEGQRPRHRRRKMLRRRHRHFTDDDPEQAANFQELDSVIDELQGLHNLHDHNSRKEMDDMTPFHAMDKMTMVGTQKPPLQSADKMKMVEDQRVPASKQNQEEVDQEGVGVSWSVWGMWSQCSVSCDKGTSFRHRQCIRRKEDSLEGEAVKVTLCQGQSRGKRTCSLFPCPITVGIPKTLRQLHEGKEGRLTCQHNLQGKVRFVYWITPGGEIVTNSTEDGKYVKKNSTLSIFRPQQSDMGEYLCVVVGSNQPFLPGYSNESSVLKSSSPAKAKGKEGKEGTREEDGSCMENPCENGGECEEVVNMQVITHGMPLHYRCNCPTGFFGQHCEQKSLVHEYTPNLRIMGFVLLGLITLLCITCTCFCTFYWIEGKKKPLAIGPIMTRRRSEDQWRKMKNFDEKGTSSKSSFSPSKIKKRLSRIWTGDVQDDSDDNPILKFGVETAPLRDLSKSVKMDDLEPDLISSYPIDSRKESEDSSHNASPLTVTELENMCESSAKANDSQSHRAEYKNMQRCQTRFAGLQRRHTEIQDNQQHHTEYPDTHKRFADFQDSQQCYSEFQNSKQPPTDYQDTERPHTQAQKSSSHVVVTLNDRKLHVGFQGQRPAINLPPSKQEQARSPDNHRGNVDLQDNQTQALQAHPTIIYSDDTMEIFSDSNLKHKQGTEERLKTESYSPYLGSPGEGHSKPYIYRSQGNTNNDSPQSLPSTFTSHRRKCKRRSKKWLRQASSVDYEFNQNNSDESNEGSSQAPQEQAGSEGTEGVTHNLEQHSDSLEHSPSSGERGHHCAYRYSSTDSGEESGGSKERSRGRGARPKVRREPQHRTRDSMSKTQTANTRVRHGWNTPNSPLLSTQQDFWGQPSRSADHKDIRQVQRTYQVYHPDEPYPYRQARSRHRSNDRENNTSPFRTGTTEVPKASVPGTTVDRTQDTQSPTVHHQLSSDTAALQHHPSASSPRGFRHLEGGGEGASAVVRTDARKSARDVLLRRAMENSYIMSTTSHELRKLDVLDRKRCVSPVVDESHATCDRPSRPVLGQSQQDAAQAQAESLNNVRLFSASAHFSSCPNVPSMRRAPQHDGTSFRALESAHPAQSYHTLPGLSMAADCTAQSHSDEHRVRSDTHLHGHKADQHEGTEDSVSGFCFNKSDTVQWPNLMAKKAGVKGTPPSMFSPCSSAFGLRHEVSSSTTNFRTHFPCFDAARRPHENTGIPTIDSVAQESTASTPVTSASEGGSFWRQASLPANFEMNNNTLSHQIGNSQSPWNRSVESTHGGIEQASTSAAQESSLMDSENEPHRKRVLKSAMKQHSSQSWLHPVDRKAKPSRRVSFREPHIHIHSNLESMLLLGRNSEDRSAGSREGSTEDTSSRHRNLLTAGQPANMWHSTLSQPTWDFLQLTSPCRQNACWPPGLHFSQDPTTMTSTYNPDPEPRSSSSGGGSPGRSVSSKTSSVPTVSQGSAADTTKSPQMTGESGGGGGQVWQKQPPLLVDIEPLSATPRDQNSICSVSMAKQGQLVPLPLHSQRLLSPLTPRPAMDSLHVEQHQTLPDPLGDAGGPHGGGGGGGGGDDWRNRAEGWGAEAAPPPTTPVTSVTSTGSPGQQGTVPFSSFQEIVAARTPNAFFKPIPGSKPTDSTEESEAGCAD